MQLDRLEKLLENLKSGELSISDAIENLRRLPFEDLGFARVDTHRSLRQGTPEAVLCAGKTAEQVVSIARSLTAAADMVLLTRADDEHVRAVTTEFDNAIVYEEARIIALGEYVRRESDAASPLVISAGTADIPVAEEAAVVLEHSGIACDRLFDVGVAGMHRIVDRLEDFSKREAIIVVAGMDGALPSVIGGLVACPVVAVPTSTGYGSAFGGIAPLLTMLNSCAHGVTVVNIDNGFGAAMAVIRMQEGRKRRSPE